MYEDRHNVSQRVEPPEDRGRGLRTRVPCDQPRVVTPGPRHRPGVEERVSVPQVVQEL